jgi:hypothetical protein
MFSIFEGMLFKGSFEAIAPWPAASLGRSAASFLASFKASFVSLLNSILCDL